ncbi:MAG: hypothetical protein WAN47_00785 [Nitrosotalea sp.]
MITLGCTHTPKSYRMTFACKTTGDYVLELCGNCHDSESRDFLINEEEIKN